MDELSYHCEKVIKFAGRIQVGFLLPITLWMALWLVQNEVSSHTIPGFPGQLQV